MIKLIVALGKDNLLGKDGKMAWHIPDEFKFFKSQTLTHSLLMGRKTFDSIPKKLEDRFIYVLSRQDEVEGADMTLNSFESVVNLLEEFKDSDDILFIAGGKEIYEQFYNYADELIVSEIKGDYKGDIHLDWDLSKFKKENISDNESFSVFIYSK